MTAEPDPAADTAAPSPSGPRLARQLAAETLRVTAWILTPEDGYQVPQAPIPELLRRTACRLLETHPARGTIRCAQAVEVAAAAAQFVLAVRRAPVDAAPAAAGEVDRATGLEALPRVELPQVLLTAARVCQHAPVN